MFHMAEQLFHKDLTMLTFPDIQLMNLDLLIAKTSSDYYHINSIRSLQLPPWVVVSVAAGMAIARSQPVVAEKNITKFGDLETLSFLFPANDYAEEVIWATNMLTCSPDILKARFPDVEEFIQTKPW